MLKAAVPCKWLVVADNEEGVCVQPLAVSTVQVLSHGLHWAVCAARLADEDFCSVLELVCLRLLDKEGVPALVEIHTVSCRVNPVVKPSRGGCMQSGASRKRQGKMLLLTTVYCAVIVILSPQ